jgi:hypothetical protein
MRTTRANVSVRTVQRREWPPLPARDGAALAGADRAGGGAARIEGADMLVRGAPIERIGADDGDAGAPEKPGPEYDLLERGTA